MKDFDFWWYIVLGLIYVLSRLTGKKKPKRQSRNTSERDQISDSAKSSTPNSTPVESKPSAPHSIEELLQQISQRDIPAEEEEEAPEEMNGLPNRAPVPFEGYSREARVLPSEMENIEAIKPHEKIDIVPHEAIEREKPEYKRSEKFRIRKEENEAADQIYEIFSEDSGVRKAFILAEIFNRRY